MEPAPDMNKAVTRTIPQADAVRKKDRAFQERNMSEKKLLSG